MANCNKMQDKLQDRNKEIRKITLAGSAVNLILVLFKFVAGIAGASAAMVADAIHSLSDFLTDIIVLIFVRISVKPADADHNYGHGKYETLATFIVGLCLLAVGGMLMADGIEKIVGALKGEVIQTPGIIALYGALVSIVLKEILYHVTVRVGKRLNSSVVIANAWHHRTDALSSVGTGVGIGAAILFGQKWAVLDPLAASVVSIFILIAAAKLLISAIGELMEKSLPPEVGKRIEEIVAEDTDLKELHHLRTRSIGSAYSIEMHVRMPGNTSLFVAHNHTRELEKRLRAEFGEETHVNIHIEPEKVNGEYCECSRFSE